MRESTAGAQAGVEAVMSGRQLGGQLQGIKGIAGFAVKRR